MPAKPPAPDDKIGKKIGFLAKALGQALAPHGFESKGRTLWRHVGEARGRRRDIVNLQGNKWNEGAEGAFYINLSVQFPALTEAVGRMPSMQWLLAYVDTIEEAAGHMRERLERLLPSGADDWRDLRQIGQVNITEQTDLPALATRLSATVEQLALPWFKQRATLKAVLEESEMFGVGPLEGLCAAMWLEQRDTANALLARWSGRLAEGRIAPLEELLPWLSELGLDASPVTAAAPRHGG